MRKLLAFLLGLLPALVGAGSGPHSCVWGSACTFPIDIYAEDGGDFALTADIAIPTGDIELYCPGQAVSSGTLTVTEIAPRGFTLTVPSALTDCARFEVKVRDQDATPAYLAKSAHVETCGNAAAAVVNCTDALSTHAPTDIVTGGAIGTTGGAVDNVTTVANNTDMRGTDNASTHAPTDIVTGGAINTSGGAVSTVTVTGEATALGAAAETSILIQTGAALSNVRLDQLMDVALVGQPGPGSLFGDMTEDDPGAPGTQRYTAAALAQAPSGAPGPVDLNPDQSGVTIGTVNTVANPTTCGTVQDKDDYNLGASQTSVTIGTCNTLNTLQPSALANMFNTDSGTTYAASVGGSVVREIADNAQTASVTVEEIVQGMGGIRTAIATVTDATNFTLVAGSSVSLSYQDEYTVVIGDQGDSDNSTCHRQILGYLGPSRTVTIDSACPAGFTLAAGDPVTILPNGAGAQIAVVNVTNGRVETDLTVPVDGSLSLGCMLSAINAVQTGAQTVVGGTDYTYRNPGDTENRVVATRTASGRTQATITCPAGT